MDIFAHGFSGVLLSQVARRKDDAQQDRIFYFTTCVGAMILPDLDAVSYLFGPDAFAAIHQKYTHTIFALVLIPPLAATALHLVFKHYSWILTWLLVTVGMSIHIAEDLIAHWPVRFFYPFSQKGWAFGLIRKDFSIVVDFIFIIGAMVTFYDRATPYRRIIAILTFIIVAVYLFLGPGF